MAVSQTPWLYRAMRSDMEDLRAAEQETMNRLHATDLRYLVLDSIAHGSRERSPFLHASWSLNVARQYFNTLQANWTGMCVIRIDFND